MWLKGQVPQTAVKNLWVFVDSLFTFNKQISDAVKGPFYQPLLFLSKTPTLETVYHSCYSYTGCLWNLKLILKCYCLFSRPSLISFTIYGRSFNHVFCFQVTDVVVSRTFLLTEKLRHTNSQCF